MQKYPTKTAAPKLRRPLSPAQKAVQKLTPIFQACQSRGLKITPENKDARLRAVADAPGVVPALRSALGALVDAAATAADDDENPFTDVAINGAALVKSNDLALIVARGLIEKMCEDLTAAAADQEKYLRDELARFEQMELETPTT